MLFFRIVSSILLGKKKNICIYIRRTRSSVFMFHLSINMCMTRNCFKLKTEIHYNLLLSFSEGIFRAYRNMKKYDR
jgi:hypothetical protein